MIKKISIHIIKILSSILISAMLVIAVGLFRLSEAPLKLRTDLFDEFIKIENIDYGDVFLENPNLSASPIIRIHDVKYSGKNFKIQSEIIAAKWNIFKILYGSFALSSLDILRPVVSIDYDKKEQKDDGAVALPESVSNIHNILNNTWLPAKNIHVKNGRVTFYKNKKQVGKIESITFDYKTHRNSSFGNLEVRPSLNTNPILLSTYYNKDKDTLDFKLRSKDLLIEKTYIPYRLRPLINRIGPVAKNPITFYSEGSLSFSDPSLGGQIKTTLSCSAHPDTDDKVKISINNKLSVIDQTIKIENRIKTDPFNWADLEILWPADLGKSARSWVLENMSGGQSLPGTLDFNILYNLKNNAINIENLKGTVGVKETTVKYLGDLPEIKNATAQAEFDHNKFDIKILNGEVYNLKITGGNVLLYDLDQNENKAEINLAIKGPVQDALTLVNKEPLVFLKTYKINPSDFSGNADIDLKLNFPLGPDLTPTAVISSTKAHLTDLKYLYKFNNQDITIDNGIMDLDVSNSGLKLSGDCQIDGKDSHFLWEESFKKNPEKLRMLKIKTDSPLINLAKYTPHFVKKYLSNKDIILSQGLTKAELIYTQKDPVTATLSLNLDLSDNTFDVLPIEVRVSRSKDNSFKALFNFTKDELKSIEYLDLIAKPIRFKSSIDYDKNGNIKDLKINEIFVSDPHIKVKGSLKNHRLNLKIKAGKMGLMPIIDLVNKEEKKNTPSSDYKFESNIDAEIKSVQLTNGVTLPDVIIKSLYSKGEPETITIKSIKDDKTLIDFYYGPREDKTIFDFKTETLSDLLSGFNIHNHIKSTLLYIHAEKPLKSNQAMVGKLKIKDLHVKNTPILANLFSLMSLESLLSTLTGKGMLFMKGVAHYEYKDKKIAVTKSSLTSSGIGLTAQGYIDINKDLLDLDGVIIPANVLNQAIAGIPIIGNILTAGETESGIVSNSYTLKGSLSDPKISANPLSVLAPTFVKRIFFGLFGAEEKEINIENFPDLSVKS